MRSGAASPDNPRTPPKCGDPAVAEPGSHPYLGGVLRFVSKSPGYTITFKRDIIRTFGQGETQVLQPLWNCQFSPVGIKAEEIEQAKKWAINHGMALEQDQVTTVDSAYRFSVFDTEEFQALHADDVFERTPDGFTDALRLELEQFLIDHQDEYYRQVEVIVIPPPWPNYDATKGVRGLPTAQRIAEKVAEDGYDIDAVLAYERANRNRQEVLDAVAGLRDEPVVEDELLVTA